MLRRLIGSEDSRTVTSAALFASGVDIPRRTVAGVSITQDNSLRIAAAYAAVRLIADTTSMLPMDTYVRVNGERRPYRPKPTWVDFPDVDGRPRSSFLQQWLVSKLVSHAACVRIVRDGSGDVLGFSVLDPSRVEPKRDRSGAIYYSIDNGAFSVAGGDMIYDAELIKPGSIKGSSRVDEMRETFGLSKALTEWSASFFGNGSHAAGIIEVPGEMNREQAENLQDAWESGHKGIRKAYRPGILSGGAKWTQTSVDPDKAQAIQAREFALEEVARIFRIPPAMLQSTKPGTQAYASREQDALQFVTFTLLPYITALEAHLSRLLPGDVFVKFNVDGLLRASLQDRYAAYSQGIQAGFLSINDIHRLEDLRPVDGGDVYRVPLANVNLEAANIVEIDKKVLMASRLINVGFDPASVMDQLGLPPIEHTGVPSVQLQSITGIAETNANPDMPTDTQDVYPQRSVDPEVLADSIAGAIREMPAPVVNVSLPETAARSKRVERDEDGNITAIIEE